MPIKVCVRVKGDGIEIGLTGSADQVETGFNVPFEGSACFCAIRSLLLDAETSESKVPSNQGSFRPVDVIAPKGSIFNPNFPAALAIAPRQGRSGQSRTDARRFDAGSRLGSTLEPTTAMLYRQPAKRMAQPHIL